MQSSKQAYMRASCGGHESAAYLTCRRVSRAHSSSRIGTLPDRLRKHGSTFRSIQDAGQSLIVDPLPAHSSAERSRCSGTILGTYLGTSCMYCIAWGLSYHVAGGALLD